ncbi:hypothetical protein [Botrimarina hoheduenensis]|uniref:hypothetical protein n=1 Tax=Botrimarina hoheduenensis TaxID=2528000 RepID=UPI0011B6AB03|nr:hypothetical protein [Botrimarina hoheduenensis]
MHNIGFAFTPSLASNDHQVRILVDEKDWLGDSLLGIDPPEFFAQLALTIGGELLVGRCECGCVGCDDMTVQVVRNQDAVKWIDCRDSELTFSTAQYDLAMHRAKNDFAWESPNRTAERRAAKILNGIVLPDGFSFQWASTRIRDSVLTLSFLRDGVQKIVDLVWDGVRPESACASATTFVAQLGEQSHALEPAAGPDTDGKSLPPAQ